MNRPTVSVIMAVYNAASCVGRAIRSVIDQTFTEFELICVDDGSADNSIDVLNRFAKLDSRIRIVKNPHQGACATLNTGLDAANGRYIAFLDNDDAFHPRTLEFAVSAIEQYHLDVVIWDRVEVGEDGCERVRFATIERMPRIELITDYVGWGSGDHHVAFWCKLYRREAIESIHFETNVFHGDLLFYWNLFSKHELAVGHLPIALHWYCVRPDSMIHGPINERIAVDKVRALHFIYGYVKHDKPLWHRIRKEVFPERVWSIFKIMRRTPEVRCAVLAQLRTIHRLGIFRWRDMPLLRQIKMRLSCALWTCKMRGFPNEAL